jgi:hypothetical protein
MLPISSIAARPCKSCRIQRSAGITGGTCSSLITPSRGLILNWPDAGSERRFYLKGHRVAEPQEANCAVGRRLYRADYLNLTCSGRDQGNQAGWYNRWEQLHCDCNGPLRGPANRAKDWFNAASCVRLFLLSVLDALAERIINARHFQRRCRVGGIVPVPASGHASFPGPFTPPQFPKSSASSTPASSLRPCCNSFVAAGFRPAAGNVGIKRGLSPQENT